MAKPYPKEFRDDVVAVARKGQAPLAQIAKDFGISEGSLTNWMKKADIEDGHEEMARRRREFEAAGGPKFPASQTPWQEIQRGMVDQLGNGMVLKPAVAYQRVAETKGLPRDNH